jgi:hypothetical protein
MISAEQMLRTGRCIRAGNIFNANIR